MNGPFSTPSHDILKTDHAILVAGGIGITPFASILESVVLILRESSKICPCGCEHRVFFGKEAGFRLKRVGYLRMSSVIKLTFYSLRYFAIIHRFIGCRFSVGAVNIQTAISYHSRVFVQNNKQNNHRYNL